MSFKTDLLKLKPQVLQTIISNLPKPAQKFRLTIKFPSQQKYKEFLRLEQLRKEQEDNQVQLKSESDQDQENDKIQEESVDSKNSKQMSRSNASSIKSVKKKQEPKKTQQFNYINLEFQNAIIYKQHYQDKFNEIGVKNKVKVSILPKKIKFVGQQVDDIQSAMEDSQKLIDSIVIKLISKYGAQAHQSEYIKRELRSKDIQIVKVLNKYYLWYELKDILDKQSKIKIQKQINQLRDRIFQNSCHKFYSLLKGGQFQENFDKQGQIKDNSNQSYKLHLLDQDINFFQSKNEKWYIKLQKLCKSKMFDNQIREKLNELYTQQKFIQLTTLKDFLIIHCDKQEQLSLREQEIKLHYRDFDFFFITFDQNKDYDDILQTLQQCQYLQKKKFSDFDDTTPYIHSISNLQLLKEEKKQLKQQFLTICLAFSLVKHNNKEMLEQLFEKLFKINSNFKISFQLGNSQLLETDQNPKLQFDYQSEQKVIHVTPKNKTWTNFQTIINDYIINHNLLKYNKPQTDITIIGQNSMSVTSPIQDSTFMNMNDKTQDLINQSNILDSLKQPENMSMGMKKKQVQKEDEQKWKDYQQVKKLKLYNFFIPQTEEEYNAKFDQKVKPEQFINNIKIAIKKRRQLQELIKPFTNIQYKPFGVKISSITKNFKFYQKSEDKMDQIVTMFTQLPKRIGKSMIEDNFAIYPLSDSEKLKKNGYLINIKRKNIYPALKRVSKTQYVCFFQAKNSDPYEVVRYLQHISPLM